MADAEVIFDTLCDKFNFPPVNPMIWHEARDRYEMEQKLEKAVPDLMVLAGLVKSGQYVVEAAEHSEQAERHWERNSHLLVIIKPSQACAATAPIKSMEFRFLTDGPDEVVSVDFNIKTAKETFTYYLGNQESLNGFVKEVAKLGHQKLGRGGCWEHHVKDHGFLRDVASAKFKPPQP